MFRWLSDYPVICIKINAKTKTFFDFHFIGQFFGTSKMTDEFRSFTVETVLSVFFKNRVPSRASLIYEWLPTRIENYHSKEVSAKTE